MAEAVRNGLFSTLKRSATRPLRAKPGDILLALMGAALGVTCALFPWYIFFHQEDFGIRALKFRGGDLTATAPAGMQPTGALLMNPLPAPEIPAVQLDLFATGTPHDDKDGPRSPPGLKEQPFPMRPAPFKLIHVENGRAMIEDEVGIFVVERGSVLPDDSRVLGFERRGGGWVMLTSGERIVELAR